MIEYSASNIEYWKKPAKGALFLVLAATVCLSCAGTKNIADANTSQQAAIEDKDKSDAVRIDAILTRLDRKSREVKTYEAKIVYLFKQPALESESLRSGTLYYANGEKDSKLRIDFTSLRQDNEPAPKYREEYFFDGVNLTRIDYKLKNVEYRQLADANRPLNAFDLASRYLPIVGFTKADKLRDDFEISIPSAAGSDAAMYDELLLKTKPQSQYRNDYTQIRFWIDKRSSMPVRMEAASPQEDIYDIRLEDAKINKALPDNIFNVEVPADFSKNIVPLKN
jgi:outer membrane lipoprotein-sorting protein